MRPPVPARRRACLSNPSGCRGVERGAGGVLFQPFLETVRPAVRSERDRRFVGLAFLEVAYAPGVRGVQVLAQHARKRRLSAALELDEGLRFVVSGERGSCAVALRS